LRVVETASENDGKCNHKKQPGWISQQQLQQQQLSVAVGCCLLQRKKAIHPKINFQLDLAMASKFFHVHHEFRAGKAQQWWETAQTAMAPSGLRC